MAEKVVVVQPGHKHHFVYAGRTCWDGHIYKCKCGKKKVYAKGQTAEKDCD